MSGGSLRLRLLAAAALSIAVALLVAGLALVAIFEREVRGRLEAELDNHLLQLAGALELDIGGALSVTRDLADPRFGRPLSGLYWQIDADAEPKTLKSASLVDDLLRPGAQGPNDERLIVRSRDVTLEQDERSATARLTVAIDAASLETAVATFRRSLAWSLGLIGLALTAAAWAQVSVGLSPLRKIRSGLAAVRDGRANLLDGDFPNEIAPLAADFNTVLEAQEKLLARARSRAGDLAHGLKTPLTVLSAVARDVARAGLKVEAAEIEAQAGAMGHHIERELARARLASGRAVTLTPLHDTVAKVIAAMKRAPRGEAIAWDNAVAKPAAVAVERQDLTELLGNLLDNARKWSASRVRIAFDGTALTVDDDGPGVPEEKRETILKRGARLDERAQGSGLGLAIVKDIAEVYGLTLKVGASPLGGLAVGVVFPRAA